MATEGFIKYKSDYKYQLAEDYKVTTSIKPASAVASDYIELDTQGTLLIKKGYAWDGPSGPVKDTHENMRGSIVHDALYQLMREKKLSTRTHRKAADQIFKDICKEDGVSAIRASAYYKALQKFGRPAASPENKKVIHRAPKE